jgi:hypothetical protein
MPRLGAQAAPKKEPVGPKIPDFEQCVANRDFLGAVTLLEFKKQSAPKVCAPAGSHPEASFGVFGVRSTRWSGASVGEQQMHRCGRLAEREGVWAWGTLAAIRARMLARATIRVWV